MDELIASAMLSRQTNRQILAAQAHLMTDEQLKEDVEFFETYISFGYKKELAAARAELRRRYVSGNDIITTI